MAAVTADNLRLQDVAWRPQPGSQRAFLKSPVYETLYSGERGPGKTDALLMDFAQHTGVGFGHHWRGIIFRRTYPELEDIIAKSRAWFAQFAPEAKFNEQKTKWKWPTGEELLFRNFEKPRDYWKYHGHAYPFIGWEELTNWPDDQCYTSMFACSRSTRADMPRKYRGTTNPYGVGHQWVKMRWRLEGCPLTDQVVTPIIRDAADDDGNLEPHRVTVFGKLVENRILLTADPDYPKRIRASASNPAMADAWMSGSWDIIAGGMFEHCWDRNVHIVPAFAIPPQWKVDRCYDYGSSKPFAVLWVAESDGSDFQDGNGNWRSSVRGDLFVIREWYGWTGKPNEGVPTTMAQTTLGIRDRENRWGLAGRVSSGPADTNIFTEENGTSLAAEMAKPVRMEDGKMIRGVQWTRANKKPGSRKLGWKKMVEMFEAAKVPGPVMLPDGRTITFARENPGLFVFDTHCPQFLRTVPVLPRDEKDMDDVDTDAEDHIGDAIRYRVLNTGAKAGGGTTAGHY